MSNIKCYKGFDKDLKCRGFKYEVGGEYEAETADICNKGFHACESPLDVFVYYPPGEGARYCEVELDENGQRRDDSKRVGKHIKIGAEIGIPGLIKAHFEYVNRNVIESIKKGDSESATAGNRGAATAGDSGAATAGYMGAATAGDSGAATAGDSGAATAGNRGAATAGYMGAATAGDSGAATAGYMGAATAGDYGAAFSRGSAATGEYGFAIARGKGVKVKGGISAILVIAEEAKTSSNLVNWKAEVVDGKRIKTDTWYRLENGEFTEC